MFVVGELETITICTTEIENLAKIDILMYQGHQQWRGDYESG